LDRSEDGQDERVQDEKKAEAKQALHQTQDNRKDLSSKVLPVLRSLSAGGTNEEALAKEKQGEKIRVLTPSAPPRSRHIRRNTLN